MNGDVNENELWKGGEEGRRGAREHKPSERNYRRWSLKSSSAWSNGIVDLGFSQVESSGYWLPQDSSRSGARNNQIISRWENTTDTFCILFFTQIF